MCDKLRKKEVLEMFYGLKNRKELYGHGPSSPVNTTMKCLFNKDKELKSPDTTAVNIFYLDAIYRTRLTANWKQGGAELWGFCHNLVSKHGDKLQNFLDESEIKDVKCENEVNRAREKVEELAEWTGEKIIQWNNSGKKNSVKPISFWTKFLVFRSGKSFMYDKFSRFGINSIFYPDIQTECNVEKFFCDSMKVYGWLFPNECINFANVKYLDAFLVVQGRKHFYDTVEPRKNTKIKPRKLE